MIDFSVENNREHVRVLAWMGNFEFKAIEVEAAEIGENALTRDGRRPEAARCVRQMNIRLFCIL